MAGSKLPDGDSAPGQKEKAWALAVTAIAAIVGSYLFAGCLLPVIGLVVVGVWLVYGGAAAVLVIAVPVAAICFALYRFSRRNDGRP